MQYYSVFAVGRRLLYAEKFSRADTLQTAVVVRIHIFSISLFSLFLRFLCCGFCDIILFMELFGLEKLSLVDYDSHTAATVFTGGCNFRCPFCHNGSLVVTSQNDFRISEEGCAILTDYDGGCRQKTATCTASLPRNRAPVSRNASAIRRHLTRRHLTGQRIPNKKTVKSHRQVAPSAFGQH